MQSLEFIIESHLDCISFLFENLSLELNLLFPFFECSNLSFNYGLPVLKKTLGSLRKRILFFLFQPDCLVFNLGIVNSCSKLFEREEWLPAIALLWSHMPLEGELSGKHSLIEC